MSSFERPSPADWGRHPIYDIEKWHTPEQARPRPDFRWSDTDEPADPHRQVAAGFLIFQSMQAGRWVGASWGRIALTVLEKTDETRLRSDIARWRLLRLATLRIAPVFVPYPSWIRPEIPPYASKLNESAIRDHWGAERLQEVANGLHELVNRELVIRANNRERSPVFFPTERLVKILSRYRIRALPDPTTGARSS